MEPVDVGELRWQWAQALQADEARPLSELQEQFLKEVVPQILGYVDDRNTLLKKLELMKAALEA